MSERLTAIKAEISALQAEHSSGKRFRFSGENVELVCAEEGAESSAYVAASNE